MNYDPLNAEQLAERLCSVKAPEQALERIIEDAKAYAKSASRFRPVAGHEALCDLHAYREGVRDGKLQAARIAEEVLLEAKCGR